MTRFRTVLLSMVAGCVFIQTPDVNWSNGVSPVQDHRPTPLSAAHATPQDTLTALGEISGTVYSLSGETLPGAVIKILDQKSYPPTLVTTVCSGQYGRYRIRLEPGSYSLTCYYSDEYFAGRSTSIIARDLSDGEQRRIDVCLHSANGLIITDYQHRYPFDRRAILPGQSIDCTFDYRLHAPMGVPKMDMHLGVGIEDKPQFFEVIGTPGTYPGIAGTINCVLTAPLGPGEYTVYAAHIDKTSILPDTLKTEYRRDVRDRRTGYCIPIATLQVLETSAVISGAVHSGNAATSDLLISAERANSSGWSRSATADSRGHFHLQVPRGSYTLSVQTIREMSWQYTRVDSRLQIEEHETVTVDIPLRGDRSLSFRSVSLPVQEPTMKIHPGEQIPVSAVFTIHQTENLSSEKPTIVVGIGPHAHDSWTPKDSEQVNEYSSENSFLLRAPEEAGEYPIYAFFAQGGTVARAFQDYESNLDQIPFRYIRLGSIRVSER